MIRGIRRISGMFTGLSQHGKRNMVSHGHKPNGYYKQKTCNYRDGNIYMKHKKPPVKQASCNASHGVNLF